MGDSSGKSTDGLHFLGMNELPLHIPFQGNIPGNTFNACGPAFIVINGVYAELNVDLLSLGIVDLYLKGLGRLFLCTYFFPEACMEFRYYQIEHAHGEKLLSGVSGQFCAARVDIYEVSFAIYDEDHLRKIFQKAFQFFPVKILTVLCRRLR